jgi:hypothetical protein
MTDVNLGREEQPRRSRSRARQLITKEQLALEELERADGDLPQATQAMLNRITAEHLSHLINPILEDGCYSILSQVRRQERSRVWHERQPSAQSRRRADRRRARSGRRRVEVLAEATIESLYMFRLPSGKRLGDANRREVEAAAGVYGSHLRDMSVKHEWLTLIASGLEADDIVRDVYSENKLRQLKARAERQ